jgi:DNA (cytosine-5)-methyltransferase 1
METIRLGGLFDGKTKHQAGSVWDKEKLAPTIDTMQGGCREPMIIEDFYSNREERVYEDVCPTLRSERNGLKVMTNNQTCISTKGKKIDVASTILAGYERTNMTGFNADNGVMEIVRIKQATSQGYIECEVGGVADLSFPDSNTRRGIVQEKGQVSPALMAGEQDICRIENQYRIRKLTPLECWRLMDFSDEDFEKAEQVNSNTQLYKQAGNSIVRNVLVAILGQMIPGKENVYSQ